MTRTSNTACSVIHLSSKNPHRLRRTQWIHMLTHSKLRGLDAGCDRAIKIGGVALNPPTTFTGPALANAYKVLERPGNLPGAARQAHADFWKGQATQRGCVRAVIPWLDGGSCCCCPLHLLLLQVEADIRPFRGMLLGLFFVTTGSSLDLNLFFQQWPIVIALTGGLIATKIGIIGSVAQLFGLTKCALHLCLSPPQVQHPCHVNLKYTNDLRLGSNVSAVPPEE